MLIHLALCYECDKMTIEGVKLFGDKDSIYAVTSCPKCSSKTKARLLMSVIVLEPI